MACGLRAGPAFPGSQTELPRASDRAWAAASQVQLSSSMACTKNGCHCKIFCKASVRKMYFF